MAHRNRTGEFGSITLEDCGVKRVALIGSGGFVGARILEMDKLGAQGFHGIEWVPVIRQFRGLGRVSKLGIRDYRMGDLSKPESLENALKGCSAAVNLTMGDDTRILTDVQNLHRACVHAKVETLIHLSSAEVFGRCDTPGLGDDSPWKKDHWMLYARAKGEAEDWLRTVENGSGPTIVVLRPGLIWGPRSGWLAEPAQAIHDGTAYYIDGGKWACNLCFVDNLALSLAEIVQHPVGGFYNIGDVDRPTWREFYQELGQVLGRDVSKLTDFPESAYRPGWKDRVAGLARSPLAKSIKKRMQNQTKAAMKFWLIEKFGGGSMHLPGPSLSRGSWWARTVRYHLPIEKLSRNYPNIKLLTFKQAMARSAEWLTFSGFHER